MQAIGIASASYTAQGLSAASKIQRIVDNSGHSSHKNPDNVVLAVSLDLPSLKETDNAKFTTFRIQDNNGHLNELSLSFDMVGQDVLQVEVAGAGLSAGGVASFQIHLNQDGSIQGFDTDGTGQINQVDSLNLDLTGRGELVNFSFSNAGLGALEYGTTSLESHLLNMLQGSAATGGGGGGAAAPEASTVTGTSGDDILTGTSAADTIDGGAGTDTVDYSGYISSIIANIANMTATDGSGSTDSLVNIENVTGSAYDDQITGDTGDNVIIGGAGNDTINDGAGGTDTLTGSTGSDTFVVSDASGTVTITDFQVGTDTLNLTAVSTISSYGELKSVASDDGFGNTIIDLGGGNSLTLTGVAESDISNADATF